MAASLHRRLFPLVLASLVAFAWLTLWTRSPYGRYLDHGDGALAEPFSTLCRALPGGALPAAFTAAGWTLMILAMMLPTTLSLFDAFARVVASRPDQTRCSRSSASATSPRGAVSASSRMGCTGCCWPVSRGCRRSRGAAG